MHKPRRRILFVAVILAAFSLGYFTAAGRGAEPADPIFAVWKMDTAKSVNNRGGKHELYPKQATRTLVPQGDGFLMSLQTSPTGPVVTYFAKFDGKDYPDTRFPDRNGTLAHWKIGPNLILRLRKTNGVPVEWVVYTCSPDGTIFTSKSWVPNHPELEDLQVFSRGQ